MTRVFGAGLVLSAWMFMACGGKTPAPQVPSPPRIVMFEASAEQLQQGESVTLTFTAENAREVELVDHTGARVELDGDAASGSATLTPGETSFYVLRATGDGGRDTAFVQVAVDEDLRRVFLIAVPPVVDSGEPSALLWSAQRARSAMLQTSGGQAVALDAEADSGVFEVTPARTLAYTLVASGVDTANPLTATAEVKVRPMLADFTATPSAAKVGETITLRWTTRGATELTVAEATFGELGRYVVPAEQQQVDAGELVWTVPDSLPSGDAINDGRPLRFILTAKTANPAVTRIATLDSYVGDGPRVLDFRAPDAVTEGKSVTLSWRTFNATRLQILADGAVVHELSSPAQLASVVEGEVTLPGPSEHTDYELRAWSHLDGVAKAWHTVAVVKAPVVTTFELTGTVAQPGDPATASWTTQHATSVNLRVKYGPVVFTTGVVNGSTDVFPGLRTTFILEAFNDAGDKATMERTVEVIAPDVVTAAPSPSLAGQPVTIDWTVTGVSDLIGLPSGAPAHTTIPPIDFFDLATHVDADELVFSSSDDAVETIPLSTPFLFPLAGSLNDTFYVSTNGFVAFEPTAALKDNLPLDGLDSLPPMIAPFWDDLWLGAQGRVLYLVDGSAFPRRLIIQWDKVKLTDDGASQLVFQVQLFENGEARFVYATLTGSNALGQTASIGFRLNGTLNFERGQAGVPTLTSGDELSWFTSVPLQGQLQYVPLRPGAFTLFGHRPAGGWVVFPAKVNPIAPGSVVLNELMAAPHAGAPAGRWVEFANVTSQVVDLAGTELKVSSSGVTWTLPEAAVIPPKGFLVVGESDDSSSNGGAPVEIVWSGIGPADTTDDTLELLVNGNPIASMSYLATELVPGQSLVSPASAIDAAGMPILCPRTRTYGSVDSLGTPGDSNETCFEYSLQSIPGTWENLYDSPAATVLYNTSGQSGFREVTLPVPFTYFGKTYTGFSVSSGGFLTFGHTLTSHLIETSCNSAGVCNDTAPGTPVPNGVVAPFWDEILTNSANTSLGLKTGSITMERKNGYTVVAWDNLRIWGETSSRVFFQVKLFDSGVIEFHYGDMVAATSAAKSLHHTGASATIWIERPDGSAALPIGINQAGTIQPHSGYRFTPNN